MLKYNKGGGVQCTYLQCRLTHQNHHYLVVLHHTTSLETPGYRKRKREVTAKTIKAALKFPRCQLHWLVHQLHSLLIGSIRVPIIDSAIDW